MNPQESSSALRESMDSVVDEALRLQWIRWPELETSLSPSRLVHVRNDTRYHVEFLTSALWADEPLLFDDYVRWVKILFANMGLPEDWLPGSLQDISSAVRTVMGENASEVSAIVDRAVEGIAGMDTMLPSFMPAGMPHGALAVRYLGAVLGGDRFAASKAVLDAVDEGTSVEDIYTHVFQRTQLELGRLWQLNRITVAQEHYATAVTQLVMSQLYPLIFTPSKTGSRIVIACVGGELHEMGARMVADFFEMRGWDSHYLGANTPPSAIVDAVERNAADVLALSATMAFHVPAIAEVIIAMRASEHGERVKVLVGGYPFNLAPELWKRVGADGHAFDAAGALTCAEQLVA